MLRDISKIEKSDIGGKIRCNFKRVSSNIFNVKNDNFKIEFSINCEFLNRNDEICFLETELQVTPLKQSLLARPVAKELGMRLSEALVNIKTCFEFEKSLLTSKYEYLLRHWIEHPEAYENKDKEDKGNKIDLEKDWRKYCC